MVRKRTLQKHRLKQRSKPKPNANDPTPEEIWGPGGLAEQERMKRPDWEKNERWPRREQ
jgi:hypothetical protein